MKVIDLLQRIANGEEVPKKIQVYSDIFVFDDSNKVYEHEETRTNLLSIYNGNILNYEVAIIEDKKIERITNKAFLNSPFGELVGEKFNEIIDAINEMREDK